MGGIIMNELYWISVVGKLHIAFGVSIGISLIFLAIVILGEGDADEDLEIKSLSYKCKFFMILTLIFALCTILTPNKKELYLIYGAGTILDYCEGDSKVKEIPDKAIEALNRYLDSIAEDKKREIEYE